VEYSVHPTLLDEVWTKVKIKKKDKKEKSHFKLFVSHIIGGELVFLFKR
jgi:hypothetical protein